MNDALSKYINTAIEIIVFALLLTIIALFGGISKDALNNKVETNVIMKEMVEYRALYKYIEITQKDSIDERKVKGDDVANFVTEFKRKYDIEIRNTKGTRDLNKTDVDSSLWEIDKVLEFLGSTITEEYSIDMIYDEDRDIIDKFIFTY